MVAFRYAAAASALLLFMTGCSGDDPGSVAEPNDAPGQAADAGPRPFNPEDWDESNYFNASFADLTADQLDPTVLAPCDLLSPEQQEQFLGPMLVDPLPEDLAGSPGCSWSGEDGLMAAFVHDNGDLNAMVGVLQTATFDDSEGFRREVIDVGGYPAATTEPPHSDTCDLEIAVSDVYTIEIQAFGAPIDGCDFTVDFVTAILGNLQSA